MSSERLRPLGLFIWFLAALFFLYEFFLRVFVATIADEVIEALSINAQELALITSAYYLTYSFMQVPVGILVDRFGSRLLLTIAVFLAALGGFWFAFAHSFSIGFISRCLMGFGSSFAYVCLLVLALNWFPHKHFGLMIGIANFIGAAGPMLAGGPLASLLALFNNNWRLVLGMIGTAGFILTFLIGLFVRNAPGRDKKAIVHLDTSSEPLLSRLKALSKNPQVWGVMLYAGFIYVCMPLMGAYWGTLYLKSRGLDRVTAASMSTLLWLGLAVAAPLFGKISDSIKKRKPVLMFVAALGIVDSLAILYWPTTNPFLYGLFFLLLGFASCGHVVSFATISEHVEKRLHATAIGMNNSMIMLFAAILPTFVTAIIQYAAHSKESADYTTAHFQEGLALMPVFYGIAFLVATFWIRETYCRQQNEIVLLKSTN